MVIGKLTGSTFIYVFFRFESRFRYEIDKSLNLI